MNVCRIWKLLSLALALFVTVSAVAEETKKDKPQ